MRLDTRACWIDAFEVPDRPDRLLDDLQGVSVSFDHWIMEERARFETRWRAVLERNLENLIAENAVPARRASAARDLLAVLPTHDAAVRALMKAFIDMDEPGGGNSGVRTAPTACRRCRNTGGSRDIRPVLRDPGGTTSATIAPVGGPAAERSRSPEPDAKQNSGIDNAVEMAMTSSSSIGPSIAVLPLWNLSGSDTSNYIVEGITEDLAETLSRIPDLFVVSRLSAATFRNHRSLAPRDRDGARRPLSCFG